MLSSRGRCGFAWPLARLGSRLRLTAAVGEAAAVKKVTVRVLDEAIARCKKKKKMVGCGTLGYCCYKTHGADAPAKQSHSPPRWVHSYKMTALRLERSNQQPYIY